MAILKIARMGHPILRLKANPVDDPTAPAVRALVSDMQDTLADIGGIGLAAPQIHVSQRIVIFEVPALRVGVEEAIPLTILINPKIDLLGEETAFGWEACLSVPGLMGYVPRHDRIVYRGYDLSGKEIEREAGGFHARVVQHECDHLDGILYPMRMSDLSQLVFADEYRRHHPDTLEEAD